MQYPGVKIQNTILKYVSDEDYLKFIQNIPTIVYGRDKTPDDREIIHNLIVGKQMIFITSTPLTSHVVDNVLSLISSSWQIACAALHGESLYGWYICIRKLIYHPKRLFMLYFDPLVLQTSIEKAVVDVNCCYLTGTSKKPDYATLAVR